MGTAEPSAAVAAMLGAERARAAVRVSFGEDLGRDQLDAGLAVLLPLVHRRSPHSSSGG